MNKQIYSQEDINLKAFQLEKLLSKLEHEIHKTIADKSKKVIESLEQVFF